MNMQQLYESSAEQSRQLVDAFLSALDQRQPLAQWVMPQTSVVWNGAPLAGADALTQVIAQTPRTLHTVSGFNCHPLPNNNITVTVSGSVDIGEEKQRGVSQFAYTIFLILVQIPNGPLAIQTMTYRLVHKHPESLLDH